MRHARLACHLFAIASASLALVSETNAGMTVALGYDQWKPSLAAPIELLAGEYELTPMLNPDGRWEGLSAFFSGGGWNSFQWNVAIWDSNSDVNHDTTNANRIAWCRTNNYGNPGGGTTLREPWMLSTLLSRGIGWWEPRIIRVMHRIDSRLQRQEPTTSESTTAT